MFNDLFWFVSYHFEHWLLGIIHLTFANCSEKQICQTDPAPWLKGQGLAWHQVVLSSSSKAVLLHLFLYCKKPSTILGTSLHRRRKKQATRRKLPIWSQGRSVSWLWTLLMICFHRKSIKPLSASLSFLVKHNIWPQWMQNLHVMRFVIRIWFHAVPQMSLKGMVLRSSARIEGRIDHFHRYPTSPSETEAFQQGQSGVTFWPRPTGSVSFHGA